MVQVQLRTEVLTQVWPDQGLNSWPPDHDSTFHVTEAPALTTCPSMTSRQAAKRSFTSTTCLIKNTKPSKYGMLLKLCVQILPSAAVYGGITIGLAFVAPLLGDALLQISLSIFGVAGGPLLGLFMSGMFFPFVNTKVRRGDKVQVYKPEYTSIICNSDLFWNQTW